MTDATLLPFDLSAVRRKKLTVDFGGGNHSSNGGLLLLRSADRKLGVCGRLADAMPDRRDGSRIRHAMFEMVMARVCAIACGHEDAIDLDRLRHDRDGARPAADFSAFKKRVDGVAKLEALWQLHDLRRTAASGMQRL